MKDYLQIFGMFFRLSAVADLQFRANIMLKCFSDIIWYISQYAIFEIIYRHTQSIAGWELPQVRTFMAILFLVDCIYMVLCSENFDQLAKKVRSGELDFILCKPINSQFMACFAKMNTAYILNFFILTGYFFWAMAQLPGGIPWTRLPVLLLAIPCGFAISFSMSFFFRASALMITESDAFTWLWYQVFKMATRPDRLYPPVLRWIILTLLPVGFIASVPARLIVDEFAWSWLAALVSLAVLLVYLTTRYWTYALRHYASASS